MRPTLAVLFALACNGQPAADVTDQDTEETSSEPGPTNTDSSATTTETLPSAGCGLAPDVATGGVQLEIDVGPGGQGVRSYWLSLPDGYDPGRAHRLVVAYAGTDYFGEWMVPYLQLEDQGDDDVIFVYPDPLWYDFPGWGWLGGWLLGPNAYPANGDSDLVFTEGLLDHLEDSYCVDTNRVFVTGHSWGGDMAMVAACFLGERFTAAIPVAANEPYWFEESPGQFLGCQGDVAVWTFFGEADDHFWWQDYAGQFGDECRDFWVAEHQCAGPNDTTDLGIGAPGECVAYGGCVSETRYCLYGPATGHQIPGYYPTAAMDWFRSF